MSELELRPTLDDLPAVGERGNINDMPELPEMFSLANQMNAELVGRKIQRVEVRQPKCLNVPVDEFLKLIQGRTICDVTSKGKWIIAALEPGAYFLLSLGMGGEVLWHKEGEALPEKYQLRFDFKDHSRLSIHFWWFGYAHAVSADELGNHKMTASLGLTPLRDAAFTPEHLEGLLKGSKGTIKSFLMNQKNIAGIGNVYVQDILFQVGLHPNCRIPDISPEKCQELYEAIIEQLTRAMKLGGLYLEKDLYGKPGRFNDFRIGYKQGKQCPVCGTPIEKIKTGSTASYICPKCQRM